MNSSQIYYQKNREKALERAAIYREKNRETIREKSRRKRRLLRKPLKHPRYIKKNNPLIEEGIKCSVCKSNLARCIIKTIPYCSKCKEELKND